MKKRKRGSTLITVVIMFMFILVVSISMLSMISTNYKNRVSESKRIENVYGADSGIEAGYNIMLTAFSTGAKNGQNYIDLLKNDEISESNKKDIIRDEYVDIYIKLNDDISYLESEIDRLEEENKTEEDKDKKRQNREKIRKYKEYIKEDKDTIEYLINEVFKSGFKYIFDYKVEENKTTFSKSISNSEYMKIGDLANDVSFDKLDYIGDLEKVNKDSKLSVIQCNLQDIDNDKNEEMITIDRNYKGDGNDIHVEFAKTTNKNYNIIIQSDFKSKNPRSIGYNAKSIQVSYNVDVPNYDEVYLRTETLDKEYECEADYKLLVGGDMLISGGANVAFYDELYVLGDCDEDINISYRNRGDKYSGGIKISELSNVTFTKDVITRKTLNVQETGNVSFKNIYAGNLFIGKVVNGKENSIHGTNFNAMDVVLDNDFTLNCSGANVSMNNLYGINDKNIKVKDEAQKEKSSSSIIINNENSRILISNSVYLMGTAYINTKDGYQTGESGAVKGNYKAYSSPVLGNEVFKLEEVDDEKYIQLLDEENVFSKATHFTEYWNTKTNEKPKKCIIWPSNTITVGAIVNNDGVVKEGSYTPELEQKGGVIYNKRKEFAENVYKLGGSVDDTAKDYDYLKEEEILMSDIMDLSKIPSSYSLENCMKNTDKYAIFNKDPEKAINIKRGSKDEIKVTSNSIDVYVSRKENSKYILNAFIATNGQVVIENTDVDSISINGCIVIDNNLVMNKSSVEIDYNQEVVNEIQNENGELFESVFNAESIDLGSVEVSTTAEYNVDNFIKKKLWKIVH